MLNVLKAIISGKRGQEVYDLLSDEEKVKLNEYAKLYGVNRRQRREIERNAKKRVHRWTHSHCRQSSVYGLLPAYGCAELESVIEILLFILPTHGISTMK